MEEDGGRQRTGARLSRHTHLPPVQLAASGNKGGGTGGQKVPTTVQRCEVVLSVQPPPSLLQLSPVKTIHICTLEFFSQTLMTRSKVA